MTVNFLAFKGATGDQRIFTARFDGSNWTPNTAIPGANSTHGPALALLNGELHMIWKGAQGDQRLFHGRVRGTSLLEADPIPGANSSHGPAATVFNGLLFATWKGAEGDQRLFSASFDGTRWTGLGPIPDANSSLGPSLTVSASQMFTTWKGMEGDQRVFFNIFDGVYTAPRPLTLNGSSNPIASDHCPAIATVSNRRYVVFIPASRQDISVSVMDGNAEGNPLVAGGSAASPALATFDDRTSMAWRGVAGDERLFFRLFPAQAPLTAGGFTPEQHIPGSNSSHSPAIVRG